VRAGDRLGRYEINAVIGRGAMGIVYSAHDPKIGRQVAIKTISLELEDDPEEQRQYRDRFFSEARAAGRLSHSGIVAIYDVGETDDRQLPYLVMEYVAGQSLKQILANEKTLPFQTALAITCQIAEALDYAHNQGVVHRDIKPANILLSSEGHAKITDFGIAKLNQSHLTLPGRIIGSPAYMAPEQLSGNEVDGRADLFSLGVILYQMISGHRPFQGNSTETVCFKVANHAPVPLSAFVPGLPPELGEIVQRAMAKNPSERYQTGMQFALDIQRLREGQSSTEQTSLPVFMSGSTEKDSAVLKTVGVHFGTKAGDYWLHGNFGTTFFTIVASVILVAALLFRRDLLPSSILVPKEFAPPTAASQIATSPVTSTNPLTSEARHVATKAVDINDSHVTSKPRSSRKTVSDKSEARLLINIEHQFREAHATISLDHQLVYERTLQGTAKSHVVFFRKTVGSQSDSLRVPAGTHVLSVRVRAPAAGYDEYRTLTVQLPSNQEQTLRIICDKKNHRLQVETH
jgi:serine/threonine protein kinase